jgi:penicillin-binding protein 1A
MLDAPIVIDEAGMEQAWRPKEMENRFFGPIRLREALVHSRNLVSVRLMRAIGGDYTWNYVTRFGFDKSQLPNDLTLALGTAELSPLQVAIGYATFANGGYKVSSYTIDRIEDASGKVLQQASPAMACYQCDHPTDPTVARSAPGAAGARGSQLDEAPHDGKTVIPPKNLAPQIIRPQVAYLLADMMKDVIRRGTGVRARSLNRDDIAGKTGTTSDFHDAWFNGFNGDLVTTVWTGFDQDRSLGEGEEGAHVAVPTWTYFMHEALAGAPKHGVPVPDGIVTVRISPETGLLASADNPNGIMEKFIEGNLPKSEAFEGPNQTNPMNDGDKPLF